MWLMVVVLAFLLALRAFLESKKAQWRGCVYWFKMTYYVAISVYNYSILQNQDWLPKYLGGEGSERIWVAENDSRLDILFQVELAYHLHSMVVDIVVGAKVEMHIHHVVTVLLISMAMMMNYTRGASIVMLLHDIPDVFAALVKGAISIAFPWLVKSSFAAVVLSWFYFRLYLFGLLNWSVAYAPVPKWTVRVPFVALLVVLQCLQVFWFGMFFYMLFQSSTSGKVVDVSVKASAYPPDHSCSFTSPASSTRTPQTKVQKVH
eukprot:m.127157 g.127157  ORF g.127157 m.127157 type:complete len:262 (+) comp13850_c0_seq3:152-937(+)